MIIANKVLNLVANQNFFRFALSRALLNITSEMGFCFSVYIVGARKRLRALLYSARVGAKDLR